MSDDWQEEIEGSVALTREGKVLIDFTLEGYFIEWELYVHPNHYEVGLLNAGNLVKITDKIAARVELTQILRDNYPKLHSKTMEHVKQMIDEAWYSPCIANRQVQEQVANAM
jgi:hypothetical protein